MFGALTHVVTPVSIEIVALRRGAHRGFEVFLARRPDTPSEPYPGQWHSPGTFVYATDDGFPSPPILRLDEREIEPARYRWPKFAGFATTAVPPRGRALQLVHCARIEGTPAHGAFFSLDALPEPMHDQHRKIIRIAISKAEDLGW